MRPLRNILVQSRRYASAGHGNERPTTLESVKQIIPSAMTYGAFAGGMVLYLTDWKLILQYVPFYNSKFQD